MSEDDWKADLETLDERDKPYARRYRARLLDGDPVAERTMRQYKAGELRSREAILIGGCPRRSA